MYLAQPSHDTIICIHIAYGHDAAEHSHAWATSHSNLNCTPVVVMQRSSDSIVDCQPAGYQDRKVIEKLVGGIVQNEDYLDRNKYARMEQHRADQLISGGEASLSAKFKKLYNLVPSFALL